MPSFNPEAPIFRTQLPAPAPAAPIPPTAVLAAPFIPAAASVAPTLPAAALAAPFIPAAALAPPILSVTAPSALTLPAALTSPAISTLTPSLPGSMLLCLGLIMSEDVSPWAEPASITSTEENPWVVGSFPITSSSLGKKSQLSEKMKELLEDSTPDEPSPPGSSGTWTPTSISPPSSTGRTSRSTSVTSISSSGESGVLFKVYGEADVDALTSSITSRSSQPVSGQSAQQSESSSSEERGRKRFTSREKRLNYWADRTRRQKRLEMERQGRSNERKGRALRWWKKDL
ncbi:hypothetical protein MMC12_001285 [Toensbergia leucococca]|nr:hypothetical protein [Toensbergia leucococca]